MKYILFAVFFSVWSLLGLCQEMPHWLCKDHELVCCNSSEEDCELELHECGCYTEKPTCSDSLTEKQDETTEEMEDTPEVEGHETPEKLSMKCKDLWKTVQGAAEDCPHFDAVEMFRGFLSHHPKCPDTPDIQKHQDSMQNFCLEESCGPLFLGSLEEFLLEGCFKEMIDLLAEADREKGVTEEAITLKKSETVAKYSTTLGLLGSMCHKYDDHFCSSLIMKHNLPILSLFKKFEEDGSIAPTTCEAVEHLGCCRGSSYNLRDKLLTYFQDHGLESAEMSKKLIEKVRHALESQCPALKKPIESCLIESGSSEEAMETTEETLETPTPSPAVLRRLQRYAAGRVTCVDGVFVEGCSASAAYGGYRAAPIRPYGSVRRTGRRAGRRGGRRAARRGRV
eukprot:Platyproteum_vivax@DN6929_c0_g3_i2.p1